MKKEIWFDMDGTIADLYGVDGWLEMLRAEDPTPYEIARPLVNLQALARVLNRLQRQGYTINVVSWLAKFSTKEYDVKVTEAKIEWLDTHLHSVKFNRIDILKYGTPKQIGRSGILFDDEEKNRNDWNDLAYDVHDIIEVLKTL